MKSYGLSTNNLEFLDFLQSEICEKILTTNKLKIHVETGNIYYNNNDPSESIFDFFLKQQDTKRNYLLIMILFTAVVIIIIFNG